MNKSEQLTECYIKYMLSLAPLSHRDESMEFEIAHACGSAMIGYELALLRGADPVLAACAAQIHDFGRVITGLQKNHAEVGYEPVTAYLRSLSLFSEEEIDVIATAVKNHSRKTEVGTVIEEIVKDADVIDCYHRGMPFDRPEKEERYQKWLAELKDYQ